MMGDQWLHLWEVRCSNRKNRRMDHGTEYQPRKIPISDG
jgi:hypothetical protein